MGMVEQKSTGYTYVTSDEKREAGPVLAVQFHSSIRMRNILMTARTLTLFWISFAHEWWLLPSRFMSKYRWLVCYRSRKVPSLSLNSYIHNRVGLTPFDTLIMECESKQSAKANRLMDQLISSPVYPVDLATASIPSNLTPLLSTLFSFFVNIWIGRRAECIGKSMRLAMFLNVITIRLIKRCLW